MPLTLLARKWAHKRFDSNVFVGEPSPAGDDAFVAISGFPVYHEFYNDSLAGLSASGYLIEVARQANLAVSHRFFDVPLQSAFMGTSIDWQFEDDRPFVVRELEPFSVTTTVVEVHRRKGAVCKLVTRSEFRAPRGRFLAGGATFLIGSRAVDAEAPAPVESPVLTPSLAPSDAQVRLTKDVLIGRSCGERIRLLVDPSHPFFFEHPNVHVPGMMLLEGGKQAAVHAALRAFSVLEGMYGDLYSGQLRFARFAELRAPVWMVPRFVALEETEHGFRLPVELAFEQREREIGRLSGALAFVDAEEALEASAILRRRTEGHGARAASTPPRRGQPL